MGTNKVRCEFQHRIQGFPNIRRCWEMNATWYAPSEQFLCPSHATLVNAKRDQDKAQHPSSKSRTFEELEELIETLGGSIFQHDGGQITIIWSPKTAAALMLPKSSKYISLSMIPKTTIRTIVASAEDLETCSWCSTEVPDKTLIDTDNGRICAICNDKEG